MRHSLRTARGPAIVLVLCGVLGGFATAVQAAEESTPASLAGALKSGSTTLALRYRLEHVSSDVAAVADHDALASTLRTVLGYRTAAFRGVSGMVEFENVSVLGDESYDNRGAGSLNNGVVDRPVVADPRITAVTRAFAQYAATPRVTLAAGRNELAYDDQRFVGPVGWRQHHQTFDAASVRIDAPGAVQVAYDFAWQVNRVFGDSKPMATHFVNASHRPGATGVTLFYHHADFDRAADAGASRATMGVRVDGRPRVGEWTVRYDLAYAEQADTGDNPADIDATYYHVELGAAGKAGEVGVSGRAGLERLGGNATEGQFQTPFATLHAFNGWADMFLATPTAGLSDTYVGLAASPAPFGVDLALHVFTADDGDADYGTEFDAQITYQASWGQQFGAKLAFYDADAFATDTRKLWFWTQYVVR